MSRNEPPRVFYAPHEVEPEDVTPPARYFKTTCSAHGCPLPGAFSDSTQGSTSWVCWIHDHVISAHWQAATAEVNRLAWVVAVMNVVAAWLPFDEGWKEGATRAATRMAVPDLAPSATERGVAYVHRLRRYITASVLQHCHTRSKTEARPKQREVWAHVKELVANGPRGE